MQQIQLCTFICIDLIDFSFIYIYIFTIPIVYAYHISPERDAVTLCVSDLFQLFHQKITHRSSQLPCPNCMSIDSIDSEYVSQVFLCSRNGNQRVCFRRNSGNRTCTYDSSQLDYLGSFRGAQKNLLQKKHRKMIPASDPKQCVVGILKGKVERTQNHQWLQASRTRATLVVKAWCSFKVVSVGRDTVPG